MSTKRPNITLLHGRVMIERYEPETISKGGIHIAETAQHERFEADVIAVGPGSFVDFTPEGRPRYEPMPIKVGDHVLFSKYTGVEWTDKDSGKKYLVLLSEDVIMVIN